jgi:hypothetical protein
MDGTDRGKPGRRTYGTLELVGLAVFALTLLPGLALTALSPQAWPIPAVALVGLLTVGLAGGRRPSTSSRDASRRVAAEASTGIAELESWLAQRHHT